MARSVYTPPPPSNLPSTHQHHQPQLQQLRECSLVCPDHPGHRTPLRRKGHCVPCLPAQPCPAPRTSPTHKLSSFSVRAVPLEKTK